MCPPKAQGLKECVGSTYPYSRGVSPPCDPGCGRQGGQLGEVAHQGSRLGLWCWFRSVLSTSIIVAIAADIPHHVAGDWCKENLLKEALAQRRYKPKLGVMNLLHAPFPQGPVVVTDDPLLPLSGRVQRLVFLQQSETTECYEPTWRQHHRSRFYT